MNSSELSDVLVQEHDGVLHVTLNRPDRRNALSATVLESLQRIADHVQTRCGELRAVVIRGAGGVFCAGGDIKDFRNVFQDGEVDRSAITAGNRSYGTLLSRLDRLPVPVVAAVEKAAMGGGVGLACIADITIATADTVFSLTETTLGLPPAQIAAFVVDRIGTHQARRLMLTAARVDAAQAARIGLADIVVPDAAALDAAIDDTLTHIRRCAPGANAMTKTLVCETKTRPRADLLDYAADRFADAMLDHEAHEGVSSFLQKRAPTWAALNGTGPR
jgi:isohexenylglutaconyl-CoA hydratase